ncbi:LOW QUALITY PROTEIN: probable galacturonosyltransferase 11 [Arabidopsis lyrata subsp. lyrata]|uniref:LOW QUALITY PROTEIN: probable galacturonosyltransferase 11 n=1 Tax=Arabidopsis lyrata subsp. lyrata TaxID=81972 RepID=UPI000A29B18D|nr:LOW QUALITY PROTEIN: probable galacturonosyltransferase 11 [Arabidopsis lyrata subsp. lyrata]|eukprot:XP_020890177.1 LOW QUALITY PROTEIN: probable galacturonosyltransferase 11 [Arabidopsis lyrata subsp. lyrata]
MVTMKSHIKNPTVQTTVFGQSVVKALPKSLECSVVEVTSNWLTEPSLQELVDENINSTRLVDNNLYHFVIES